MTSNTAPQYCWRNYKFSAYVFLTYAISWTVWLIGLLIPNTILASIVFYLGSFGPALAAIVMLRRRGASPLAWFKALFRWRIPLQWYLFVLIFPGVLASVAMGLYTLVGYPIDPTLLPNRLATYIPLLMMAATIGGGNEEPGWRGFGLPILQEKFSPFKATLILGIVWALWHLPLLGSDPAVQTGEVQGTQILAKVALLLLSITCHAFWYTWIVNRTGSVLLCVLLHAGYNATNSSLILIPEAELYGEAEMVLLPIMTGITLVSVIVLLILTRGRLGKA
ncbi:MAG: CPBP family intramembrane glutamic endopeptidase [Cyanobacteria bacterium J06638_22]